MLTDFSTLITTVASIISGLGVVWSCSTKGRSWWKGWWQHRKDKKAMPRVLGEIKEQVSEMQKELQTNGGSSIKDEVRLLVSERLMELQEAPFPAFRCASGGDNIFSNRAYEMLVGADDHSLHGLGWRSYLFDEEQGDNYYRRWIEVAKTGSHFTGLLKFKNARGEYRGEWTVRVVPLGPYKSHDQVWGGRFFPFDDKAIEVANKYKWHLHQQFHK